MEGGLTGKMKMVVNTIKTEPSRQVSQPATLSEYRSAAERKIWPHCTIPPMMLPRNMITIQISVNSCKEHEDLFQLLSLPLQSSTPFLQTPQICLASVQGHNQGSGL